MIGTGVECAAVHATSAVKKKGKKKKEKKKEKKTRLPISSEIKTFFVVVAH